MLGDRCDDRLNRNSILKVLTLYAMQEPLIVCPIDFLYNIINISTHKLNQFSFGK